MDENEQATSRTRNAPRDLCSARALRRARGSLLWGTAVAGACGAGDRARVAFSWGGLWLVLPPLARAIGLFIFAVAIALSALPLLIVRLPSVHDGLRRLDRSTGETHPRWNLRLPIASPPTVRIPSPRRSGRHMSSALWSRQCKFRPGWPTPRPSAAGSNGRACSRAHSCGGKLLLRRGQLAPPRRCTGMAWSRRRIFASMPGSCHRSIPGGLR